MINTSELRIGSMVDYTGMEHYISWIDRCGSVALIIDNNVQNHRCAREVTSSELNPLPINRERLEKIGFVRGKLQYTFDSEPVKISVEERETAWISKLYMQTGLTIIKVNAMHQIQYLKSIASFLNQRIIGFESPVIKFEN